MSVRNLGVIFDDKLSMKQEGSKMLVYLPGIELSQLHMYSQLMLSKLLSDAWYCHVLTTVTTCCHECLNS